MAFTNLLKQKNITLYLEELGLSTIEINIYLTLLENGPINVRELASKVQIKRTTAYFYIKGLLKKGLVNTVKGQIYPQKPNESIQRLVDNKIKLAAKIQTTFPDILEMINATLPAKNISGISEIKYYYGKNSVKNIYLDLLAARDIRGITNISEFLDIFPDMFQVVDKAIQQDKQKKYYEIVDDSPKTQEALQKSLEITNKRYQYKYFPEGMAISSSIVTIYDGKVSIVNTRDTVNGVILQNDILYDNFKQLFDLIWNNISLPY